MNISEIGADVEELPPSRPASVQEVNINPRTDPYVHMLSLYPFLMEWVPEDTRIHR